MWVRRRYSLPIKIDRVRGKAIALTIDKLVQSSAWSTMANSRAIRAARKDALGDYDVERAARAFGRRDGVIAGDYCAQMIARCICLKSRKAPVTNSRLAGSVTLRPGPVKFMVEF